MLLLDIIAIRRLLSIVEADGKDFFLGRFYHGAMTHVSFLAFDLNYGPWEKKYYYDFIKEPYGEPPTKQMNIHVCVRCFSESIIAFAP